MRVLDSIARVEYLRYSSYTAPHSPSHVENGNGVIPVVTKNSALNEDADAVRRRLGRECSSCKHAITVLPVCLRRSRSD